MKQLFTTIRESIFGPTFYRDLRTKPLSYSWKYYSAFALLLAVFLTIVSSIPLVIIANKVVREFPKQFFDYVPDDLEIKVTNGVLSINATEPYIFPVPTGLQELASKDGISSLAIIDTQTPFSLEQFNSYQTLLWVGGKQFAYRDQDNAIKLESFESKTNVTINETLLRSLEGMVSPYYQFVGPVIVIVIFLGMLVALGVNFAYLVVGALFILVLGRVMKKNFTYGESYRIGLHAITLPLLLQVALAVTPFSLFNIPFAMTLIMLVVVYANFREIPSIETEAPVMEKLEDTNISG